ncbi:hypothetical protein BGW38_005769, partial [Lunasporangiospora selenospora]
MSENLFRSMYKGRPPPLPPLFDDTDQGDEGQDHEIHEQDLEISALRIDPLNPSPAVHPSLSSQYKLPSRPGQKGLKNRYAPVEWNEYFDQKRQILVACGSDGQDTSDSTKDDSEATFTVYEMCGKPGAPLFVFHHGAGLNGLSFALAAKEIKKLAGDEVSVLSYDARGHGETTSTDELNLSLDRLAKDLRNVILAVIGEQTPEILLVGHSMGGAVISEAASRGMIPHLVGVAVLDIVEGVAIETLANMDGWLKRRPTLFRSLDQVIQWGVRSGTVRNLESARVSCPPLVTPAKESNTDSPIYVWRTDLAASEQYWKGWFTGLTQKFLSAKAGRLLILAGTDRLDTEMTIAQMQG